MSPIVFTGISPEQYDLFLDRAKLDSSITIHKNHGSISSAGLELEFSYADDTLTFVTISKPCYVFRRHVQELLDLWLEQPDKGSSYNEHWDTGFAQDGDPYGIQYEYLPQSANPDALPTQEQADAEAARGN